MLIWVLENLIWEECYGVVYVHYAHRRQTEFTTLVTIKPIFSYKEQIMKMANSNGQIVQTMANFICLNKIMANWTGITLRLPHIPYIEHKN